MLYRFYAAHPLFAEGVEQCFYFDLPAEPTDSEAERLRYLVSPLAEPPYRDAHSEPMFADNHVVEVGPRLAIESPFSTNAKGICRNVGLYPARVEVSTRYSTRYNSAKDIERRFLDVMTQEIYPTGGLLSFASDARPEAVMTYPLLAGGEKLLATLNKQLGLGMDDADQKFVLELYRKWGRNPTNVELIQLGNANSEHSRHWFIRGQLLIDGIAATSTLMDLVKGPMERLRPNNSLVAFHDNSGVMEGPEVRALAAMLPTGPSRLRVQKIRQHITATAETHNHPTMIASFPGAETGVGGRIRDSRAVGRGALMHAGFSGYAVSGPNLKGYEIPGEGRRGIPVRYTPGVRMLIEGSNGIKDYGNKIGEPTLGGFTRSFEMFVDGHLRTWDKPVLYSAGLGRLDHRHLRKHEPAVGMLVIQIGGPQYPIGIGGGAASSMGGGDNTLENDLKSVQRGDAEMENRVNRVIQACAEMGEDNPVEAIHDQGAGGPSNVLTELVEPGGLGGRIDIAKIVASDNLSTLARWVAEAQERYGLLVRPQNLERLQKLCERERVNCEVVGEVTGDGNITVYDSRDGSVAVDMPLRDVLTELPQKTYKLERLPRKREPLKYPEGLTVSRALEMVLRLPSVGSKGYLVHKKDRSVTGLVALQPCCGPMQIPVANAGVTADGYFDRTGAVGALGEQPIKMLVDAAAGARMAVGEALTNLASVRVSSIRDVKCRLNEMWAAKLPGEGALLYDAVHAASSLMEGLGFCADGGKDSLSMSVQAGKELVVAPGQLVVYLYAPVPDIRSVATPDFKSAGNSIGFLRLGSEAGAMRMGGSAFAQAYGMLGDESPDADAAVLRQAFEAVQEMIRQNLIKAYHDRSDGGLITTLVEMCLAGNVGAQIVCPVSDALPALFNEELGMVFEYQPGKRKDIERVLGSLWPRFSKIGTTTATRRLVVSTNEGRVLNEQLTTLRSWWEMTSSKFEQLQTTRQAVIDEWASFDKGESIPYHLPFEPRSPVPIESPRLHKAAVLREEGSNGDREMSAALKSAGFAVYDLSMQDILRGDVKNLERFRFLAYPGGFSYADVFGSAKGWAAGIRYHETVSAMFKAFYSRGNTLSLGVCNGCQLMGLLDLGGGTAEEPVRLVHNASGRFESRWVGVSVPRNTKALMFSDMEGMIAGIHVSHGEGRFRFSDSAQFLRLRMNGQVALAYVNPEGQATEEYPYNPNGSPFGVAGLCSSDGRHLMMMPHPERCFLPWQCHYLPEDWKRYSASPWLQMFHNAYEWSKYH